MEPSETKADIVKKGRNSLAQEEIADLRQNGLSVTLPLDKWAQPTNQGITRLSADGTHKPTHQELQGARKAEVLKQAGIANDRAADYTVYSQTSTIETETVANGVRTTGRVERTEHIVDQTGVRGVTYPTAIVVEENTFDGTSRAIGSSTVILTEGRNANGDDISRVNATAALANGTVINKQMELGADYLSVKTSRNGLLVSEDMYPQPALLRKGQLLSAPSEAKPMSQNRGSSSLNDRGGEFVVQGAANPDGDASPEPKGYHLDPERVQTAAAMMALQGAANPDGDATPEPKGYKIDPQKLQRAASIIALQGPANPDSDASPEPKGYHLNSLARTWDNWVKQELAITCVEFGPRQVKEF